MLNVIEDIQITADSSKRQYNRFYETEEKEQLESIASSAIMSFIQPLQWCQALNSLNVIPINPHSNNGVSTIISPTL